MTIDWNAFTPWSALIGGLLIGLASALYLLGSGRVAGIAGNIAVAGEATFLAMGRASPCKVAIPRFHLAVPSN